MIYENQTFDQERALYGIQDSLIKNCRFAGPADGESFLKECKNIEVSSCFMDLRYPLWHVTNGKISNCEMTENCRAALWYDSNIEISNCTMNGIKALRECRNVTLKNTSVKSPEFIWKVDGLTIEGVNILESEYPFFEVKKAKNCHLSMKGKYSFQYVENMSVEDSKFDTKDAFWHSKNVTVKNSIIKGEYLGWYSDNLTLINCHIEGTQPLCYCTNLKLINCTTSGCDLAFETSDVEATIIGKIDSIKNPRSGNVYVDELGETVNEYTKYPVNGKVFVKHRQ